jgi:hypothetical protein
MDIGKWFVRGGANMDQRLGVFKDFYLMADVDQRQKLKAYVTAVADLAPRGVNESVKFDQSIGCGNNYFIGVQFTCSFLPDGPEAVIGPHVLCDAMNAWDRSEEYLPSVDS